MPEIPPTLRQRLRQAKQEHVLAFWDRLDDAQRRELIEQLENIDLDELSRLYSLPERKDSVPGPEHITPIARPESAGIERSRPLGEQALRAGQVAVLVVAG